VVVASRDALLLTAQFGQDRLPGSHALTGARCKDAKLLVPDEAISLRLAETPTMNAGIQVKTVVVTGDITLDWNLGRSRGSEGPGSSAEAEVCSRLRWQRGGAALLWRLAICTIK